ncbi:conserved hypothetical protein [Gloeothece citriformis PCC 7424]|uniref:Knr4/Smi1-like domain-containing protein n=1 Tax=Gloeothece citriformis (strain PCC 7424) TaxID=65393 RepID=B7KI30_GLOC7|nr:SMI1/KNR4 family protein [Gloeothece citriformis]ACK73517.1 conserved hypothetical protein [Gloeothece citriformis PCC 7424]
MNNSRLEQLKQKLHHLAQLDKTQQIYGSEIHQYKIYPCLSSSNIENFESQYRVSLPEDYRQFLLNIANGGVGPGYGLFQLKTEAQLDEPTRVLLNQYESQMLPERLAQNYNHYCQPFPSEPFPLYQSLQEWEKLRQDLNLDRDKWGYFSQKLTEGAIEICAYGCGITAILALTGDYQGTIWIDDRANDGGIYPCTLANCAYFHSEDGEMDDPEDTPEEEHPLTFFDWYEDWIDRSTQILLNNS